MLNIILLTKTFLFNETGSFISELLYYLNYNSFPKLIYICKINYIIYKIDIN